MTAPATVPVQPPQFDEAAFARAYAGVAMPVVASAAVAPSPFVWAVFWALLGGAWAVDREVRMRRRVAFRAAQPALESAQVSAAKDSTEDSRGQLERTAA